MLQPTYLLPEYYTIPVPILDNLLPPPSITTAIITTTTTITTTLGRFKGRYPTLSFLGSIS